MGMLQDPKMQLTETTLKTLLTPDYINHHHESKDEHHCRCERMTRTLEDSLECPVCRDKISGHVYQCHAGHVMCSPCRTRLLTCPVCRSLLTLPAIRNRALEKLAFLLG